jgi:virulence-associated protein VagC
VRTAEVVELQGAQAVKLPDDFRFDATTVWISRQGTAVLLQPRKPASWPATFFDEIRIDDPAFARPDQGTTPPAPQLG